MNAETDITVVTFDRVNDKGAYGINPSDGKPIYLHELAEVKPLLGDTYMCRVTTPAMYVPAYYFALPVQKLDLNAILKLSPDTLALVSEYACKHHPELFVNKAPEKVAEPEVKAEVQEKVKTTDNRDKFVYVGENTLSSSLLTKCRYDVYRSYDGKHLAIIQNRNGEICCESGSLLLNGLDEMMNGGAGTVVKHTTIQGRHYLTIA